MCVGTSCIKIGLNLIPWQSTGGNRKHLAQQAGNYLPATGHSAIHTGMNTLSGKPALPFALPDSSGHLHTLEEYRGSWLLMVFHRHLG
jgi:hypothetical protein